MQLCVINLVSLFVYSNLHLIQAVETLVKSENHLDCNNGTLLSQNICLPSGYLEGEVPEKPTIVTTRIEINNIREVNDKKMRITLDFYQELLWVDNRIKTNLEVDEVSVLNSKMINRLWKPDLWIKNLFESFMYAYRIHHNMVFFFFFEFPSCGKTFSDLLLTS